MDNKSNDNQWTYEETRKNIENWVDKNPDCLNPEDRSLFEEYYYGVVSYHFKYEPINKQAVIDLAKEYAAYEYTQNCEQNLEVLKDYLINFNGMNTDFDDSFDLLQCTIRDAATSALLLQRLPDNKESAEHIMRCVVDTTDCTRVVAGTFKKLTKLLFENKEV